jgi:hypothetical protein
VKVSRFFWDQLHDRVWIIDFKRGFTTGTSLNSIGTKVSFINEMSDNDFNDFWILLNQAVKLD